MMPYIALGLIGIGIKWTIDDMMKGDILEIQLLNIGILVCEVILFILVVLSIVL